MNPYDFVNAINSKQKNDLMTGSDNDQLAEASYVPYVVNKALSYFPDTVMYANAMNQYNHLDNKLQFHYLLNTVRPGKRFSKWTKRNDSDELQLVMEYYSFSMEKAKQVLPILSIEQLTLIKNNLTHGVEE
jgi:hypothetical protein